MPKRKNKPGMGRGGGFGGRGARSMLFMQSLMRGMMRGMGMRGGGGGFGGRGMGRGFRGRGRGGPGGMDRQNSNGGD